MYTKSQIVVLKVITNIKNTLAVQILLVKTQNMYTIINNVINDL